MYTKRGYYALVCRTCIFFVLVLVVVSPQTWGRISGGYFALIVVLVDVVNSSLVPPKYQTVRIVCPFCCKCFICGVEDEFGYKILAKKSEKLGYAFCGGRRCRSHPNVPIVEE